MPEPRTRTSSAGKLLIDSAVFLLMTGLALFITRPWIQHPLTTSIGYYDPPMELPTPDAMMNMTFGGWIHFSLFELGRWPLAHSEYLMFPAGAAQGTSFDSLLSGVMIGLLDCVMPLLTANALAVVLAYVLSGFISYLYA